jgi:hypothetical protein
MTALVTTRRRVVAMALTVIGAGSALSAQSGTTSVDATVVTPVAVTGVAPLDFGTVFRGINRTVAWNAATSGRFHITGQGTSQLAITFTLPATLSNGFSTMPINRYRVRVNGVNSPLFATNVVVTSGTPITRNLVAGSLWFFVGARVQPTTTQAPGTYAAPVILTAAYTGL